MLFGHFANWFRHVSDIEDALCWGNVCLGLHIGYRLGGFVTVLSFGV